jgi:hypothetical protein
MEPEIPAPKDDILRRTVEICCNVKPSDAS